MKTPLPVDVLIQLATEKRDIAANALAGARRQSEEARQKYEMLARYQAEYLARMGTAGQQGTDLVRMSNHRAFLAKLEHALNQQQQETEACDSYLNACFHRLRNEEKKLLALQVVQNRRSEAHQRTAARNEQKVSDEFASMATSRSALKLNWKSAF